MDMQNVGKDFPIKEKMVYLNNASIGALSNSVIAAVNGFLEDVRDNGRIHYPEWCEYAEKSVKERIAKLIGANRSEIAFVKNTTEGLLIVANGLDWKPGDNVIIADIEYPSNVYCWMNLERRGVSIKWVKSKNGRILVDDIGALIDERTRLVSVSAVQFSNGYRINIKKLGDLCKGKGVLLNLDAIQYVGALEMNVSDCHVDFLSAGGHKWLLAPIGTGFFYCRAESMHHIHPQNVGYHSVDKHEAHMDYDLTFRPDAARFEEALVNFPGIWGLDATVKRFLELGTENVEGHIHTLVSQAIDGLMSKGYEILSPLGRRERSGILLFRHPVMDTDDVFAKLSEENIHISIRAGSLRISPTIYNDKREIDMLITALP
jgi:cysteine desulfurase / selenocysteine lyase